MAFGRDYRYYERLAQNQLKEKENLGEIKDFPSEPFYEAHRSLGKILDLYANHDDKILELGAGIGNVTGVLMGKSRHITALDYSQSSIEVLRMRYPNISEAIVSDMEFLPFKNDLFDWIVLVSVLSYVDHGKVQSEIIRVLRPGGHVLIIDSIRGISIYHLNRIKYVVMGKRSLRTLFRMPSVRRIESWTSHFEPIQITYTGYLVFLYPILKRILGQVDAERILKKADESKFPKKRSWAFKFFFCGKLKTDM